MTTTWLRIGVTTASSSGSEPARVAVGREHDDGRLKLVERVDARVLTQIRARFGRSGREPSHPARRLDRTVWRVPEAAAEALELGAAAARATRLRSRRRAAHHARRAPSAARPRPRPGAGSRSAGTRRRRALRATAGRPPSAARAAPPARGRAWRSPRDMASTRHGGRTRRCAHLRRRRSCAPRAAAPRAPAAARVSAHEQPVTPPPTISTSGGPSRGRVGSGAGGLLEPVRSHRATLASTDQPLLHADEARQLELRHERRQSRRVDSSRTRELVSARSCRANASSTAAASSEIVRRRRRLGHDPVRLEHVLGCASAALRPAGGAHSSRRRARS